MADAGNSIFNKQALSRLRSPDDLDRYIRVTSPSVWVALFAVLALMAGLLAWGIFGAVSTSVEATGTSVNGKTLCLLNADQAARVKIGDRAYVGGQRTTVASESKSPISPKEAYQLLGDDYLVETLMDDSWAYVVTFDDIKLEEEGVPVTVSITTERVAPIKLVLG